MKKSIVLIALLALGLAACDGNSVTSTTSTPSTPSTPSTTPSAVEPVNQDITINVTVAGIDSYEGSHTTIWINSPLVEGSTSTSWQSAALTQDTTNVNLWSITFEDVEPEQIYYYNIYYGTSEAPNWTVGRNTEGADTDRALDVTEGTTTYAITATFTVPSTVASVTVKATPTIYTSSTATESEALLDTNYLWAWNSHTSGNVLFTKGTDGVWTYTFEDVSIGTNSLQLTFVLGSETEPDWTYQMGAYSGGSWETWGNGISFTIAEDTTEIEYAPIFNAQPAEPAETGVTISFTANFTEAFTAGTVNFVYKTDDEWITDGGLWRACTASEDNKTFTYTLEDVNPYITHYIGIASWIENTGNVWIYESTGNWAGVAVTPTTSAIITFDGCAFDTTNTSNGTHTGYTVTYANA